MHTERLIKNNSLLNILYLILASFCFSLMTVCVKKIDNRIPVYELVFFRSLFSFSITYLIIKKRKIKQWGHNKPLLILRGLLGTAALVCIFYAIRNMPLNISTVIQYTYPIFISIIASFVMKEKVSKEVILALIFGWIGISVILNPYQLNDIDVEINIFSIVVAFLGSIFTSLAYITVKKLSLKEDIFVIIKYFPLVSIITLSPLVLFNWVNPSLNELIWILGIGIFTQAGQTFLTIGLKRLPTTKAATINYLQVFFGSLWGIFIFKELINTNFIFGSLLVLLGTIISTSGKLKKNLK